jgi:IS5 family transposase
VFADSAYRGAHFREAVRARGGTLCIVVTAMWGLDEQETLEHFPIILGYIRR